MPRDAASAVNYARDAYENSGDTLRGSTQAVTKTVQENPIGALLVAGGIGFALALLITRQPRRPPPSLAVLGLSACHSAARDRANPGCAIAHLASSRYNFWIPGAMLLHRSGIFLRHLAKKLPKGPSAERPILPGGRGGPGARGGGGGAGWRGAAPKPPPKPPKKSRNDGAVF